MLDEAEFASVRELYQAGFKATKDFRQQWGIPLEGASIEDRFRPVSLRYEEVTGMKDCPPNAVMHHRRSEERRVGKECQ